MLNVALAKNAGGGEGNKIVLGEGKIKTGDWDWVFSKKFFGYSLILYALKYCPWIRPRFPAVQLDPQS